MGTEENFTVIHLADAQAQKIYITKYFHLITERAEKEGTSGSHLL